MDDNNHVLFLCDKGLESLSGNEPIHMLMEHNVLVLFFSERPGFFLITRFVMFPDSLRCPSDLLTPNT